MKTTKHVMHHGIFSMKLFFKKNVFEFVIWQPVNGESMECYVNLYFSSRPREWPMIIH